MNIERLFLKEKPSRMLVLLKDNEQEWYLTKLAKESGSTYVHTTKVIRYFEEFGLVRTVSKGREKRIELIGKGLTLASALDEFRKKAEQAEADLKTTPPV